MTEKTGHTPLETEIVVRPLEEKSFAPFGDVIHANPLHMRIINNGMAKRYHDLARIESRVNNAPVLFNIFRGESFSLPVSISMMERHPYGSQAFFPLDARPFLVVVAQDAAGIPQQPQAFLAMPGQGVNYHPDIWHHPLLALDKISDFIVIDHACPEHNLEEYFYDNKYRINSLEIRTQTIKRAITSLEDLNTVSPDVFCSVLSNIFEHSPWVAKRVVSRRPFSSTDALYLCMMSEVENAGEEEKTELIRSHPDLAGKAARQGTLTDESGYEQKEAGLDQLSDEEFSEFHRLNTAYKKRFGFPCIIAVRGFEKPLNKFSILANMRKRLHNTYHNERQESLRQIARIAELRLKDLAGE